MPTLFNSPTPQAPFHRALEDAVVTSWNELMPDSGSGLIHIEYQAGPDGLLDCLFVWASTSRGYWNLVCEYWMRPMWSHATGLRFGNAYNSTTFGRSLELVMEHEGKLSVLPNHHETVQVFPPSPIANNQASLTQEQPNLAA